LAGNEAMIAPDSGIEGEGIGYYQGASYLIKQRPPQKNGYVQTAAFDIGRHIADP